MSRRLRWFLVCLPLLLAAGVSFAVGYQPNMLRNLFGPVTVTGDLSVTDDLTVTDDLSADVASVASLEFTGGGTPGLERGGNTTIQTRTGDGFVALGASGVQSTFYVWDSVSNTSNGASCSGNTSAYCINDAQGYAWTNGSGTTVGVATAAGLISGDTGVSSGAWAVMWSGGAAVPEGSNGQGGYTNTTNGRGSKFRQVTCSCRVAGSGGSDGITLSLMEDGLEVGTVEIVGGDTNACDDAAGTLLAADLNYSIVQEASYALQVKSTTDCAGNPTDCLCNIDVTR